MSAEGKFSKRAVKTLIFAIVSNALFVQSAPNATSEPHTLSSEWKPIKKPEALSTTEFAEKLAATKQQNSTDMEASDTKRSFLLVYPPRSSANQAEPQKLASPQSSQRSQSPPLRTYPTQPRYQRMMNFGASERTNGRSRAPTVYQRPKFPPVVNPPPLPEHALRNRKRIPPMFTPESTSQHQVQIQLLDGYIVPPGRGGGSNVHTEKKEPQISTFPLNLNNVPEIRLLLPGDVHQQLNNLRQQPHQQQNRPANSYPEQQGSEGRGRGSQREYPKPADKNTAYPFESQRRPGRTEHINNQNNGQNFKTHGNGRPQPSIYNQNTEQRRLNHDFSQPDRAVFPDQVKFSGQNNPNYQDQVNNPISYNQVKTHPGEISPSIEIPDRNNYPEQQKLDIRPQDATKPDGSSSVHNPSQNFGGQQNPDFPIYSSVPHHEIKTHNGQVSPSVEVSNRNNYPEQHKLDSVPHDTPPNTHDDTNVHSFLQNYGDQKNPNFPISNPIPYDQSKTPHNGQSSPSVQFPNRNNYPEQHKLGGNQYDAPPKTHDGSTIQSYPQNFGAQQNVNFPHVKTHNGQGSPSVEVSNRNNYLDQQKLHVRAPESPKTQSGSDDHNLSQNFGGQSHPDLLKYNPVLHNQVKSHPDVSSSSIEIPNRNRFPEHQRFGNRPQDPKSQGIIQVQSFPQNFGGTDRDSSRQRFQRHEEFENEGFKPLSNDNVHTNAPNGRKDNSHQAQNNNNVAGSVPSGHNLNADSKRNNQQNDISRNIYSNGWQAAHPNRGKQNFDRIPSQGKINQYSGDSGNKNVHPRGSTRHNFSQFNGENISQKSHDSVFNPPSSAHDNLGSVSDKSTSAHTSRDHIASPVGISHSQPDFIDSKLTSPQEQTTEDVYFVPPVLPHEESQSQIEPFDREVTGDTSVSTNIERPVNTQRGDGEIFDQKDYERVRNPGGTRGVDGHSDAPFARTGYCECSQNCAPVQRSPNENFGSTIREIARSLDAEAFFDYIGLSDEEIENTLAADGSYTLFIPSNEAVSRLPTNLIDHWRENNPDLTLALLNHVVRDQITLDQLKLGGRMTSRANDATIFINNYNNDAVTVNGHRIVYGDVTAPKGGTIHVIDGTLCPVADQDIINTLRSCNKYDGFLTLADVTKLLETMQDEGPYTVFLPSNEALTKIPPDELSVLKENSTALREFLEYHIVQGVYFSGDLKDSQYLTTLHRRQPVRVGVRVDGCYRRLVEANNSPLFKSDIPTKNGVIHVVDWILRPSDLQWCDGVILP